MRCEKETWFPKRTVFPAKSPRLARPILGAVVPPPREAVVAAADVTIRMLLRANWPKRVPNIYEFEAGVHCPSDSIHPSIIIMASIIHPPIFTLP